MKKKEIFFSSGQKEYQKALEFCRHKNIQLFSDINREIDGVRSVGKYTKKFLKKILSHERPEIIYLGNANLGFRRWLTNNYNCCLVVLIPKDAGIDEEIKNHSDFNLVRFKLFNYWLGNIIYLDNKKISLAYPNTLKGLWYYLKDYLVWGVRKPFTLSGAGLAKSAIVPGPKFKRLIEKESPNVKNIIIERNYTYEMYVKELKKLNIKKNKGLIVIATSAIETRRDREKAEEYYKIIDRLISFIEERHVDYILKLHPNTNKKITKRYSDKKIITGKLTVEDELLLASNTSTLITNGSSAFELAFKILNIDIVSIEYTTKIQEIEFAKNWVLISGKKIKIE